MIAILLEQITIRATEYSKSLRLNRLSAELAVLQLIVDGHSNDAIARKLYLSVGTVKTHVHNI